MARCGCGGTCGCSLTAGDNITVSGGGSPANPWVVSATIGCNEVRTCFTGDNGINVNQGTGVITACLSSDEGNELSFGTDDCLYAKADCDNVRTCLSEGPGIDYNPATGVISACLSTDLGNNLTLGTDNCLYVPTGAATVTTGCGLTGDGSGGNPVRANTTAWPYPCPIGTSGGVVSCDASTGLLKGEPRTVSDLVSTQFNRTYASLAVPAGTTGVELDTFTVPLQNPDPCRPCRVYITREVEVWFTLPGTSTTGPSTAAYGIVNDETARFFNNGATTVTNIHTQTSKTFKDTNLAAGAAGSYTLSVTGNSGTGGATYTQIEVTIRVLYIST